MGAPTDTVMIGFAAFQRRDIPAVLELFHDDVEWSYLASPATGTPYGGMGKGKQQVAEFFTRLAEADDILEFEPQEFLEGSEHITVLGRTKGKVRSSGRLYETRWVQVFVWRGDKIARYIGSSDTAARL